jgi:large subunit ribosomal protein L3
MKVIGKKMKMSQVYRNDAVVPVTPVKVGADDLNTFEEGEVVKIRGVSKGKGFQGVVKRHGFSGGPKSHGQKDRLRAPGSIGAGGVQRVIKGLKMAGRMGGNNMTVKGLRLVGVEKDRNVLLIKGAIPGNTGSKVEIHKISSNNESITNERTKSGDK